VVLAVAVMAPMTGMESTGPYSMVSGSSSAPTGPQPRGRPRPAHRLHRLHRLHRHRLRAAWAKRQSPQACRRPDPPDRGVDVAPAGRGEDVEGAVAVEPDRSHLRLPAPGEQRASRQQNRRGGALARTCRWPAQGASRLAACAESTESGRRGSGHRAHAASCACACSMRTGFARAAAGPTEAAPHAWRPGWGAHLWMVGWYPWPLKRLVTM
jgi:hypothetical protein